MRRAEDLVEVTLGIPPMQGMDSACGSVKQDDATRQHHLAPLKRQGIWFTKSMQHQRTHLSVGVAALLP